MITDLDHEANISTWAVLERMGARFLWWRMRDDGPPAHRGFQALLVPRTRRLRARSLGCPGLHRRRAHSGRAGPCRRGGLLVGAADFGRDGSIDVQALERDYPGRSGDKIFSRYMALSGSDTRSLHRLRLSARTSFRTSRRQNRGRHFHYENVAGMAGAVDDLAQVGGRRAEEAGGDARTWREDSAHGPVPHRDTYEQMLARRCQRCCATVAC